MTFVGKILVLINLVMSMLFMAFAVIVFTARQDVEAKLQNQKTQLAKANKEKQDAETLQASIQEQLKDEQQAHATTKQTLNANIEQITQQVQLLDAQLKQAQEEVAKATAALETATTEQTQRQKEVEELREIRDQLLKEKSELVTVKTNLQDELSQTKNNLEILTGRATEMEGKLQQYASWIVRHNDGIMPTDTQLEDQGELPPPPDVEGKVAEVDDTGRFIQLTIGADDGLREGHELLVWRTSPEAKYIGKIRVYDVRATTAVALPIATSGGLIRKGDNVGPRIR